MKHTLNLKITVAALALIVATESFAGGKPPWIVPEKGITEAQHLIAASLKTALTIDHRTQPYYKPARRIKWSTKMRNYGISNIDVVNIEKLFSGHYFVSVYRPPGNAKYLSVEKISVDYFGKDGEVFACTAQKNIRGGQAWRGIWKTNKKALGFGGVNIVIHSSLQNPKVLM